MKFLRHAGSDGPVLAVVDGDLARPIPGHTDLLPLLQEGALAEAAATADGGVALDDLTPLSPIATPPTFRDFYAFEQHVKAGRAWRGLDMDPDWYELPVFYFSNPYAFTGSGDVAVPPGCRRFDFELEVAAVLGGDGRDLTPEEGEDLVAGFCVLNDWSARDVQAREMRQTLGPAKGKDGATGLGPWFVTKDELADVRTATGYDLRMTCSVNGVPYSEAVWSDVFWSFGQMIAYASRGAEVRAGDVFGSGTCGTGCILELAGGPDAERYPWLRPGDVVEAGIERLGTLVNRVVSGSEPIPLR